MKNLFCLMLIGAMALFTGTMAQAQLNFTFTIVGDPAHSTTTGTITGELIGLQNNATSAPTDIIINSAPAQLGLPQLSYDLAANGWTLNGTGDTFTVTNGQVTAANYQANLGTLNFFDLDYSIYNNSVLVAQINGLEFGGTKYTSNANAFAGATYSPTAVPEPSTYALMATALALLALLRSRRLQ